VPFRMSDLAHELAVLGGDIEVALEEIRVPAALLDSDGVIRWQNAISRDRIGDRSGTPFADLVSEDATHETRALLAAILCRGEPAEFTLSLRLADGSVEARELSAVPVRDGGSVVGIFGVSAPATEAAPVAPERLAHLTERQREVLQLLVQGKSTKQIATELGISSTTVRNHVANLMAALDVHTRLQAVVVASRAGIADLSNR